jgi:adenosine kinase
MNILLSGSVAYDYLMVFPGNFRDHILPEHLDSLSLSFLVESMVRHRGGIAPNIAYTMALLGERPKLWATVGEDFEEYRAWLESKGIDTSGAKVIPDEFTASFFVNTDRSNAQIASFYPGAMAFAKDMSLYDLKPDLPDLVVISPNDPAAMVKYARECVELNIPYLYDPSQQIVRLAPEELREGILNAMAIFVNEYEAALIEKITGLVLTSILETEINTHGVFVVITRGEHGSTIYDRSGEIHIPVVPPQDIVDPTGIGDAFRGGFLTGYSHQLDLGTCGRMGALAAAYCLEQRAPQGHDFTLAEFVERYRKYFDDQGKLDRLFKE